MNEPELREEAMRILYQDAIDGLRSFMEREFDAATLAHLKSTKEFRIVADDYLQNIMGIVIEGDDVTIYFTDQVRYDAPYEVDEKGTIRFLDRPEPTDYVECFLLGRTQAEAMLPILMDLLGDMSSIAAAAQ